MSKISEYQKEKQIRKEAYEKVKRLDGLVTLDDCKLAVEHSSAILEFVPFAFKTEEICLKAFANNNFNRNLIQYIPSEMLTKDFLLSVVGISGVALKYIPLELIDVDIICKAVTQNKSAIQYIPKEYETDEIFIKLLEIYPKKLAYIIDKKPLLFEYMNNNFNLSLVLMEKVVSAKWGNLKYIPAEFITKEICDFSFNISWKSFQFFPDKYKTREMCEFVTGKSILFVEYCPIWFLTNEKCEAFIRKKGSLRCIPNELRTEKLCLLAIQNDYREFNSIPKNFLTEEFYIKSLRVNEKIIKFIPKELKTFEVYKIIIEKVSFSNYFIEWLKNIESKSYYSYSEEYMIFNELSNIYFSDEHAIDYNILRLERKKCLRSVIDVNYNIDKKTFIIKEFIYKEIVESEIQTFDELYLYLNGNLAGANLIGYDFMGVDINRYNLKDVYVSSEVLIAQGKYNGEFYNSTIGNYSNKLELLPLVKDENSASLVVREDLCDGFDSNNRKIYYITDIHINHKLEKKFPRYATYDEVRLYIQDCLKNLIGQIQDKRDYDYLLIGGDVSFSFEVSKIFYKELCKIWNPSKIVVILGNHELWDFDGKRRVSSNKTVEDVVRKYRKLFKELNINFLQNSLLIVKKDEAIVFDEEIILNKTEKCLQECALNSNMIICGGIGFSAYNVEFNASKGIYRDTIPTLTEDLKYTSRSEEVYNKLYSTFNKDKLIIFSHMPVKDWSKRKLISNWVYINGHTHKNSYIQSESCTVLADNQVGYYDSKMCLKYFRTGLYCDIFKYYSDGIYHITKKEYVEFNHFKDISVGVKKELNDIIMLKREGVYMFMVKDVKKNRLLLLNGTCTKIQKINDINYYYDNMIKFSNYIRVGVRKYNEALKKISKMVKRIGGDGTIHGLIVDIDFFNHIYLDPYEGTITAYNSPRMGKRFEYPTVEKLLEKEIPGLYIGYKRLFSGDMMPVLSSFDGDINSESATLFDTSWYKPSNLLKSLQYITEKNIIRIWDDNFISNYELEEENKIRLLNNNN